MTFSLFLKQRANSSDSSLHASRSWLPPGFSTSYLVNKKLLDSQEPSHKLNEFALLFWPLILQPLLTSSTLVDQKGGAKDDTLLRLEGQLLAGEESMPFSYSIQTRFSDFPNRNQIRFNWNSSSSIEDLEALSITELCQRSDIYFKSFLFNLENFQSNMLTRLSGFGPVVAETISLEISATSLDIRVSAEAISSLKVTPFSKDAVLEKISSLLENCYQFKLLSDYTTLQGELK
jgi:hypothetical protein